MAHAQKEAYQHRVAAAFSAIKRAAEAGEPCPTNAQLVEIMGAKSDSAGANAVSFLATAGMISVERGNSARVITITATGKRTAGSINTPHWRSRRPEIDKAAIEAAKEAAAGTDLLDEIHVEAIRTGTPMPEMLNRLLWLGFNCHVDEVLTERGAG